MTPPSKPLCVSGLALPLSGWLSHLGGTLRWWSAEGVHIVWILYGIGSHESTRSHEIAGHR